MLKALTLRVVIAMVLVALSGCLEDLFDPAVSCEDPRVGIPEVHLFGGPLNANDEITRSETPQPTPESPHANWSAQVLVWIENPGLYGVEVYGGPNWGEGMKYGPSLMLASDNILEPGETVLGLLGIVSEDYRPEPAAQVNATFFPAPVHRPSCVDKIGYRTIRLAASSDGEWVKPGSGAWIHFASFDVNGSAYWSNVPRIDADAGIPKADSYQYGGSEPLKVFVYHEDAEEMPDRYRDQGYVTVVPGLNELLKKGNTVTSRSEKVNPELAYTGPEWEGSSTGERHPLYGKDVVFYVEVKRVVVIPECIVPDPVCNVPVQALGRRGR